MFKLEEGWITVALLAAMLTAVSWGVAAAGWADGLWAGWFTGLLGLLAGLALARSRFSGTQATIFSIVYGLFAVGFFISLGLKGDWHQRSFEFVIRMNNFLYKLIYGGTSRDALPFPVFVATVMWFLGVSSAWSIFRRGAVWPAIIPGGLALLVNVYYYLGPVALDLYLAVYMLLALILVARMALLAREREWQASRVAYSPEMRFDFLRAGLVVALAAVLIGWAGPTLAASPAAATVWRRVTGPWATVRESWVRMFASVRAPGQNVNDFYGNSLTLGGPALLDDSPIMDVTIAAPSDEAPEIGAVSPILRYYWRAAAYEDYNDGRWSSDNSELREFDPDKSTEVRLPIYQLRRDVGLSFMMFVAASSRLYTAPQPKWVDRPAMFEVMLAPGGSADVASVRARDILRSGQSYTVVASFSIADQESLRAAGRSYPDWVVNNFLDLPPSISPRTHDLARQIVEDAGARTPYDQAQAITDWLRENIEYDQLIEGPPADVEPMDWFLFETRRGYCNYYATAAVVLLRSLGLPSRIAVGMAEGDFDASTNTFHVLERNAHAWPEVYFPNYGWVEFEPTVSEPALVRPERRAPTQGSGALDSQTEDQVATPQPQDRREDEREGDSQGAGSTFLTLWMLRLRRLGTALGGFLLAAVVALLAGTVLFLRMGYIGWENLGEIGRRVMRWQQLPLPSIVGLAYLNLERAARWLGLSLAAALTPHERAAALNEVVPEDVRPAVNTIAEEYVAEQYSPRPANAEAARSAWQRLRLPVVAQAVRDRLQRLTESDLSAAARRLRSKS